MLSSYPFHTMKEFFNSHFGIEMALILLICILMWQDHFRPVAPERYTFLATTSGILYRCDSRTGAVECSSFGQPIWKTIRTNTFDRFDNVPPTNHESH